MIHVKRVRLNSQVFPDSYDETKVVQDYEDNDGYSHYYIDLNDLREFFRDLLTTQLAEFNEVTRRYFTYHTPNTPVDPKTLTILLSAGDVEFKYKTKPSKTPVSPMTMLYGTDTGVQEECIEAFHDYLDSFLDVESDISRLLANFICNALDEIVVGKRDANGFYDFMQTLATCFDETKQNLYMFLLGKAQEEDWVYIAQANEHFRFNLSHMLSIYGIDKLWMAYIYTQKYTQIELSSIII